MAASLQGLLLITVKLWYGVIKRNVEMRHGEMRPGNSVGLQKALIGLTERISSLEKSTR